MSRPVRVLVVDDSAIARQMLSQMLASDPGIEVVGVAADPLIARRKINQLSPDVVTLDIEMPHMDGISFLEKIMRLRPMPVIMVSSLVADGSERAVQALELGAVDVVLKPTGDHGEGLRELRDELVSKVKAAAQAHIRPLTDRDPTPAYVMPPPAHPVSASSGPPLIAIGASTGGVLALGELLTALPGDGPPIVIVQHMRPGFTRGFATRLDQRCALHICEAEEGLRLESGMAVVAPDGHHLTIVRSGGCYVCRFDDRPPVSGHRPSVDVLFASAAAAGRHAVGVLLTGMGKDGAEGLLAMRRAGAATIGQDEASCTVYGMPRVAHEIGAVEIELPLNRIAAEILRKLAACGAS